jgi:hypothetical protein
LRRWLALFAIATGLAFAAGLTLGTAAHAKTSGHASNESDDDWGGPTRTGTTFQWHKALDPGQTVEIKGINGGISAEYTTGSEVEVEAVKRGRRSNPDEVRIVVDEHQGGVTICALYPTPSGEPANTCEPGKSGRMTSRKNDVTVYFKVKVPRGVGMTARTVNGGIEIEGLRGDVKATTVNGSITLSTNGSAQANTVNGSIRAALGKVGEETAFETVNGQIVLDLPDDLSADLDAQTVNGHIDSDFEVSVRGKITKHRLRGRIGGGGAPLALSTVNGSIELVKAGPAH